MQAVPLYLSEMAPAKIRGRVNQLFQLTTCLGILIANLINYRTDKIHPWGWRLSLGLAAVPAVLMFVGGLFLPETPNSLVEQGRLEEGRRVLERVRGTTKVDAEFADLVDASSQESTCTKKLTPTGDWGIGYPCIPTAHWHELHPLLRPCHISELGFWLRGSSVLFCLYQRSACYCSTYFNDLG